MLKDNKHMERQNESEKIPEVWEEIFDNLEPCIAGTGISEDELAQLNIAFNTINKDNILVINGRTFTSDKEYQKYLSEEAEEFDFFANE